MPKISRRVSGTNLVTGKLHVPIEIEGKRVLWLAKELGRPVKWVDSRSGFMRSTVQGRDQHMHGWLAGNRDGKITGLKVVTYANLGAYPSTIGPGVATAMVGRCVTSVYDLSLIHI